MSITDELRKALGRIRIMAEEQDDCSTLYYISPTVDELTAIADRIDREHRTALEKVAAEVDEEAMEEHGWVKLPMDADGVPIRIGDVLDEIAVATYPFVPAKVVGYHEWCGEVLPIVENDGEFQVIPEKVCHYHAPTVEDVLYEFAAKIIDSQIPGVHPTYEEAIAEYAAKLRLAEGRNNDDLC